MGVACRLSEREWLYYCIFLEMAIELHGGREWRSVEPALASAWEHGCCSVPWEDVSMMMRTHWARRSRCGDVAHAGTGDVAGNNGGKREGERGPMRPDLRG